MTPGTCSASPPTGTGPLIVVLAGLAAISPFATDMYTPGFPEMVASLGTSPPSVQLSLTACLLGTAVGQVLIGPISDSVGRRRLLLAGSALFAVFSLLCALVPSVALLNAARLFQGGAGGVGIVIGRAVISDRFAGNQAVRQIAVLSVISMTAPILAPVAGGLILSSFSWRAVFLVLAGAGLLLTAAAWAWIPETLPADEYEPHGLRRAISAMLGQLRKRVMVGYLLVLGCSVGALFAYISSSTFLFHDAFGMSATGYSLVFATNALGTVAASLMVGRLAGRLRLGSMLTAGVGVTLLSMAALFVLFSSGVVSLSVTWLSLFGLTFGFGLVLPTATSIILALGDDAPGAASGLLGGFQFVIGAVAAPLSGLWGGPVPCRGRPGDSGLCSAFWGCSRRHGPSVARRAAAIRGI